ncbi:hypothetical protein [Actinoplanes sp. NPDC026670]|uniref:hypothetical protein n=1 Tax=Actinoplanes sp. NPDC026670 TaxID=3154700 RepID=UPI0033FF29D2
MTPASDALRHIEAPAALLPDAQRSAHASGARGLPVTPFRDLVDFGHTWTVEVHKIAEGVGFEQSVPRESCTFPPAFRDLARFSRRVSPASLVDLARFSASADLARFFTLAAILHVSSRSSFAICEATLQVGAAAEVNHAFALVSVIPNEPRKITARSYGLGRPSRDDAGSGSPRAGPPAAAVVSAHVYLGAAVVSAHVRRSCAPASL